MDIDCLNCVIKYRSVVYIFTTHKCIYDPLKLNSSNLPFASNTVTITKCGVGAMFGGVVGANVSGCIGEIDGLHIGYVVGYLLGSIVGAAVGIYEGIFLG